MSGHLLAASFSLLGLMSAVQADTPRAEEPAPAIQNAPIAGDAPKKEEAKPEAPKSYWADVPPVRPAVRTGNFAVPPKGPGYYSLLDCVLGEYREKPPKFPYAPSALMQPPFYDVDFRFLDDPKNTQHDLFDPIHRIEIDDRWLFSTGGSFWTRSMHELDSRLSGRDNNYELTRLRVFGDLWYHDSLRFYVEFISAQSMNQDLVPLPIDRNYADFLNGFVDIKLCDVDCKPVFARVGRQEVQLGSQRLVTSPDWANTRRTFDGVRVFRQGEKFDVDMFWLSPVIPDARKLDSHDNNVNFAGLWTTYRPEKGQSLDMYYLFLDNTSSIRTTVNSFRLDRAPHDIHTLGTRYAGDHKSFLWDVEGMLQLGNRGQQDLVAGAATVGGGYNFSTVPMNPTFWVYFDYASGDKSPNAGGEFNTFNQLFPFGHYYFGFLDVVGRQNIQDLNFHLYAYPTNWVTCNAQVHHFRLDSARDALYSAGGVPLRMSPTGTAGRDVGNELDLSTNFHLGKHSDILIGWSKLWAGDFVKNTGSPRNPELTYLMYNIRW